MDALSQSLVSPRDVADLHQRGTIQCDLFARAGLENRFQRMQAFCKSHTDQTYNLDKNWQTHCLGKSTSCSDNHLPALRGVIRSMPTTSRLQKVMSKAQESF